MPLHLNTQADLEEAIHALVKQDPRLKPVFEIAERFADEMNLLACVQPRIVAIHVNPVNVVDGHEDDALARSHRDPIRRGALGSDASRRRRV